MISTYSTLCAQITWEELNAPAALQSDPINPIIVGALDDRTVFFECSIRASPGNVVYRTADGGHSFDSLSIRADLFFAAAQRLFVSENSNLLRMSSDAGVTWRTIWQGLTSINAMCVDSTDRLFVVSTDGHQVIIDRTSNFGLNWKSDTVFDAHSVVARTVRFHDSVGLMTVSFWGDGLLYRSSDLGHSWKQLIFHEYEPIEYMGNGIWLTTSTTVQRWGSDLHTTTYVYRSSDDGRTWDSLYFDGSWIGNIVRIDASVAYVSANGGLYRTGDAGKSWRRVSEGRVQDATFPSEHVGYGVIDGKLCRTTAQSRVESLAASRIGVTPNPFRSSITVEREDAGPDRYLVLDVLGRQQAEFPMTGQRSTVDLSALSTGAYLIKSRDGSSSFRVIKY